MEATSAWSKLKPYGLERMRRCRSVSSCVMGAHWTSGVLQSSFSKRSRKRLPTIRFGLAEPSGEPAPIGQKTRYNDNFFDKAFMSLFARKMNQITGKTGDKIENYDDFVASSRRVMQGRNAQEQREVVRQVLLSILPTGAPETFRKLFPPAKWSAEFNAAITVPFFYWLVGPSQVVEVEVNGVKQKSGVHIKKCRCHLLK
eukprot:TRINITY_DN837_c0_g1_i1.p1 TRINITY_DN837_c0_g1~~TRINITY_DN837_c0_g1_i1.p1  ORF type:complete len:200 (-),score=6.80 TRINITY_DN837_c0_g1_i1:678-1277(-)